MIRTVNYAFCLAVLACGSLQAACLREPNLAFPYGDVWTGSAGAYGSAYLFRHMGGIPAKPVLADPVDGTVLDGGSQHTGMIILPPDANGRSMRAPLVLKLSQPVTNTPAIVYMPYRVVAVIPDTTHYKFCAFEADKEADCERSSTPPDSKGFVVHEMRCEASNSYSPPNGALSGFAPSFASRVTELNWKVRACNRNRPYCSEWSDKKTLKWLPAPVLIADGNSSPRGSRRSTTPRLVASAVGGAEKTYFCLARPGDRCLERTNFNRNTGVSPSPLVRNTERHEVQTGEEILWPQLDFDGNNNPVDLSSWFDGQTVNWSAAACITLPGTSERGCVYQEQTRSVSFPP